MKIICISSMQIIWLDVSCDVINFQLYLLRLEMPLMVSSSDLQHHLFFHHPYIYFLPVSKFVQALLCIYCNGFTLSVSLIALHFCSITIQPLLCHFLVPYAIFSCLITKGTKQNCIQFHLFCVVTLHMWKRVIGKYFKIFLTELRPSEFIDGFAIAAEERLLEPYMQVWCMCSIVSTDPMNCSQAPLSMEFSR